MRPLIAASFATACRLRPDGLGRPDRGGRLLSSQELPPVMIDQPEPDHAGGERVRSPRALPAAIGRGLSYPATLLAIPKIPAPIPSDWNPSNYTVQRRESQCPVYVDTGRPSPGSNSVRSVEIPGLLCHISSSVRLLARDDFRPIRPVMNETPRSPS
jgi:hypothetical protein